MSIAPDASLWSMPGADGKSYMVPAEKTDGPFCVWVMATDSHGATKTDNKGTDPQDQPPTAEIQIVSPDPAAITTAGIFYPLYSTIRAVTHIFGSRRRFADAGEAGSRSRAFWFGRRSDALRSGGRRGPVLHRRRPRGIRRIAHGHRFLRQTGYGDPSEDHRAPRSGAVHRSVGSGLSDVADGGGHSPVADQSDGGSSSVVHDPLCRG